MKVTCDREKLLSAFQTAAAVAPARSPKPVLQNVKLDVTPEGGVISATDLEIGVRVQVDGVEAEAAGSVLLPVSRMGQILRESSDRQIRIEVDGSNTVVRGQRAVFTLPAQSPSEFPSLSEFNDSKHHLLTARLLKELVHRTSFATDNESSRYALGGVLFDMGDQQITGVGTDGRRLAKMAVPSQRHGEANSGDNTTIVPTKALQLIERALTEPDAEVKVVARANEIMIQSPRVMVYARLVEGRFPRWRDVFPQRQNSQRIDLMVGPFYAAVRQAAIVTSDESRGVDFNFNHGELTLSSRAAEVGQSKIDLPITYEGPEVSVTLDPKYVMDFLKVLDPEKTFTFDVQDSDSSVVCSTDDGYGYVIMPLSRDR